MCKVQVYESKTLWIPKEAIKMWSTKTSATKILCCNVTVSHIRSKNKQKKPTHEIIYKKTTRLPA